MSEILSLLKTLLTLLPFVALVWLGKKDNLKKPDRSRQCYMPLIAVVFCLVSGFLLDMFIGWIMTFVQNLGNWIASFGGWVGGLFDGSLEGVGNAIIAFGDWVDRLLETIDIAFWAQILVNALIVVIYLILKRIIITILKAICRPGARHYETVAKLAYRVEPKDGGYYVKEHMAQGITLMKSLYYITVGFGIVGTSVSVLLFNAGLIPSLYYPVFSVILVGEVYYFLDGARWEEEEGSLSGEDERATRICDYTFMRQVLTRHFGDKVMSDNTSVNSDLLHFRTNSEMIDALVEDDRTAVEAYGLFMRRKASQGMEVDQNYLSSGLELLQGKSVVFNNPFYYDLCPYIFFPMNRAILRRKKVLIVLGRHAIEQDVAQWCADGLLSVTNVPDLWNIGVLGKEPTDPDVGIVTRSSVHDLQMHENNEAFFKNVEFVVLVEPSRLIATAQIGLNSLVRHCRRDGKRLVFCSADKNCDGLVDALSHILMTSLEQVTATNKHSGTSSYMCWEADEEHLQHRMLPNLSRYLGVGTELSFMALKNQISHTAWYGGDAFPVKDMHWVAKQYYYDLLHFASLPTVQSTFDEVFEASPNMYSAKVRENSYITVEDESFNMYEAKRAFSTRATNQGFINVISTDYLLKDYMAANDGIFDADSKAIPYIVADYAHTERNVLYRLCLRLTAYPLTEQDIRGELALINVDLGQNMIAALWSRICKLATGEDTPCLDEKTGEQLLHITKDDKAYTFRPNVIVSELKYSVKTGRMETLYSIREPSFVEAFLSDLCSAEYVAEDETVKDRYLGTELRGHIFQKYLPGQFFTFGGKYYEMLRVALDGRVMVRRAADHIDGRPQYRQVRNYTLENITDSTGMGDCRNMGSISITKQIADITVETPAYWRMRRYNDFHTGTCISINGVPTRSYRRKELLRIDFPQELVGENATLDTVALLMNEVFRTMYAENQGMIVAVTACDAQAPITYSLSGTQVQAGSIYIIEDSQMDIGFLVSVERNLQRILSTVCDYLQWHTQTLEESLTPPAEEEKPDYTLTDEQRQAEALEEKEAKKNKGIRGFFRRIGNFFKRLFKRKPKEADPAKPVEVPAQDYMMIYGKPHKLVKGKWVPCSQEEFDKMMAKRHQAIDEKAQAEKQAKEAAKEAAEQEQTEETAVEVEATVEVEAAIEVEVEEEETSETVPEAPAEEEQPKKLSWLERRRAAKAEKKAAKEAAKAEKKAAKEAAKAEKEAAKATAAVDEPPVEEESAEATEETPVEVTEEATEEAPEALGNVAPPKYLYSLAADALAEAPTEESAEEPSQEPDSQEAASTEPASAQKPGQRERLPYYQRYYLLYGAQEEPASIRVAGALKLLQQLGFGRNALEQARNGLTEAENVERSFTPDRKGSHYCDFCGTELFGSEYDVLLDGRERCMICGRTAVRTEKEFKKIYQDVIRNLSIFYGISITAPVKIQMVNAKKLHKQLGQTFVPTGQSDGRVLGVAIKDKKNGYTILLENGSPRLSATMTMVHELTHIWQYLNWDAKKIKHLYGNKQNLEVYEGMAKWVEIQYAYLLHETATAKREEIITRLRNDPYGHGFLKYAEVYPLSTGTQLLGETPFGNPEKPL